LQIARDTLPATAGRALTDTVTVAVLEQPAALVPVSVYVVVAEGLAITVEPVVADKPAEGLQV
jgi:hypothetical protein